MSISLQTSTEHSSKELNSLKSSTPNWNNLPVTTWGHSISFLKPSHAVHTISLTSRYLAACTENSPLWKNHLFKAGITLVNTASTPTDKLTPLKLFRLTLTSLLNVFQNFKIVHNGKLIATHASIFSFTCTTKSFLSEVLKPQTSISHTEKTSLGEPRVIFLKQLFNNGVFANLVECPTYLRYHIDMHRSLEELNLISKKFKEKELPSTALEEFHSMHIPDEHYKILSETFLNIPPQLSIQELSTQIGIPLNTLFTLLENSQPRHQTICNALMDYCNGHSLTFYEEENDYSAILDTKEMWETLFKLIPSHPSAERFANFLRMVADLPRESKKYALYTFFLNTFSAEFKQKTLKFLTKNQGHSDVFKDVLTLLLQPNISPVIPDQEDISYLETCIEKYKIAHADKDPEDWFSDYLKDISNLTACIEILKQAMPQP